MIKLGPFDIDHPFILAPMAGITHSPFRRQMRKMGSSLVVSELVSANGLEYASEKTRHLLGFHEDERRIGLQIFGEDQDRLVSAAKKVAAMGCDFVDLNLGCPVPKVTKRGAGAALCRNPSELHKILKAMVQALEIPLTIKIRTGWDADHRNALDVIRAAQDAGVGWVAVHGRTRAQGYGGEADWDFIGELKAKSGFVIIGNGDLVTPELAFKRWRESGVDAVMIGRAALRNPFIFSQARALYEGNRAPLPTKEEYWAFLLNQKQELIEFFGERKGLLHSKKFLAWYAAGFRGCHEYRKEIFRFQTADDLWAASKEFFLSRTDDRDWSFLSQPFLMGGHG